MGFIEVMKERNMLAQVTHEGEFKAHLSEEPRTAYAGFDPTADSLHIGHLIPVLGLRRWQQAGHRVIAVCGGGTAMVGDPTGKSEMRQMMTEETIAENIKHIERQLSRFLILDDPKKGIVVNNASWLRPLQYLPFLREIGPHFSVNRMLTAECFKQRLEKGLSFLEFNYMLFQSYDFYHLYKTYNCTVQLGGDDQWSNILGGMELIRRKEQGQAFCMTLPLLVNSTGKKMGKTESGAVWLDPDKTAPYELFQYFRNVEDSMVEKCLYYFSDLPVATIKELSAVEGQKINDSKIVLAYEATKLIHGEEEAEKAKNMASKLFSKNQDGAKKSDAPEVVINKSDVQPEMTLIDFLLLGKLFASKSEGRRLVQQGGLTVNGEKINEINALADLKSFATASGVQVRKGKKNFFTVKLV